MVSSSSGLPTSFCNHLPLHFRISRSWRHKHLSKTGRESFGREKLIGDPLNPGPEFARWRSSQCGLVILCIERPLEKREWDRIWTFSQRQLPFRTGYEPGQCSAWVDLRLSPPFFLRVTSPVDLALWASHRGMPFMEVTTPSELPICFLSSTPDLLYWASQQACNATSKSFIQVHFHFIFWGQHQTFSS